MAVDQRITLQIMWLPLLKKHVMLCNYQHTDTMAHTHALTHTHRL